MATIISDVFGDLKIALRKINDAAIAVATVDKIIDNVVLVAFTNHVIENYNLLIVSGQRFQRNNIVGAFNNIIASHRIDSCVEIINHILVLVLMQVLSAKVNFVVDQQPVKHMHENICLTRVAWPANKHPKGICWHTRVALLVITFCSQTGVVIGNFHFFFFCYIYGKNMSMKKWRKLASEKAEVEQQNDKILATIKNNKINKEFGQLSGEDLFKPITSRLDKLQVGDSNSKEEEEVPDYGMDEFDLNNPFDEDFRPDEETPPPTPSPTPSPTPTSSPTSSPPPSPTSTPLPPLAEEEETELMEESGASRGEKPSKWGPPQELVIKESESTDLQNLNRMLTVNKNNPNYVVKSETSKFSGYTMAKLKKARDEILERRKKGIKIPIQQLMPDVDDDEPDREMEGSGSVDPNALVERLHLSLASIQAGNTSLKLKKQVQQMLGLLVKLKEITQKEAHKILGSII